MARLVEGTVLDVQCPNCSASFPTFVFCGDTDVTTWDLRTVTSIETGLLAIGSIAAQELNSDFITSKHDFARRVSQELGQTMRAIDIARVQEHANPGRSFQEFLRRYRKPVVFYVCPKCGGDAYVQEELTPENFENAGGEMILLDGLSLKVV